MQLLISEVSKAALPVHCCGPCVLLVVSGCSVIATLGEVC